MADEAAKEKLLLEWVKLQGVGANIDADYSKGFSGTKMDTILEKGFADMMRGVGSEAKCPFPRQPCSCTNDDGEHGKDCKGRWLRTLNSQGNCFLYVHTITHEIRGSQPPNFVTSDEVDADRKQRMEAALGGKWRAYASCHPEVWREAVQAAVDDGKTALLTVEDPETRRELLARMTSSSEHAAQVVDTRPFVLPATVTGIKFQDAFATMCGQIKAALKAGVPLVLNVGDYSPHFLEKLCQSPKYRKEFPENIFNPRSKAWHKDHGVPTASPGFAVVVLSSLDPKEAELELKDKLPWGLMRPIRVTTFIPALHAYLADLKRVLDEAKEARRVPLLLDATSQKSVDTFLAYQRTQQVDVPQLLASARTLEEKQEVLRAKLVACIKAGDTLLLRLKESCADFIGSLCSETCFPLRVFEFGACTSQASLEKLFKEEEKEHGVCVARDGFQVVVTSYATVEGFAAALGVKR